MDVNDWINISERLPEKLENVYYSRDVLFMGSDNTVYAGHILHFPKGNKRWEANCGCSGGDFDKEIEVTHWRELPPLPSEFKYTYAEIGTATGFRWLKADGSVGHLKAGETMPMPAQPTKAWRERPGEFEGIPDECNE